MYVCKKILLMETVVKFWSYTCGITVLSLLTDIIPLPRSFMANKYNFLNVFFVKFGWGWTLVLVGVFIYFSSYTYCCGDRSAVKRHLSRLAVGTFWWFTLTNLFNYIEHASGFCSSEVADHSSKRVCIDAGFAWLGFDISGHAFLLVHCLLTISEEVKVMKGWDRIAELIQTEEEREPGTAPRVQDDKLQKLKQYYTQYTPYVKAMFIVLAVLTLIWELMLLGTTLYFHNMPQKLVGTLFAGFAWFMSYGVIYRSDSDITPCLPGKGSVLLNQARR